MSAELNNKNICRILWAEDNHSLQMTIPVDFKNAINELKENIQKILNITFETAKLDRKTNCIALHDSNDEIVYSFHLDLAINGKIAIEKFYKNLSAYNFLLFDEIMPLVNGSEAIAVIREKNSEILIISWSSNSTLRAEALHAGANQFFSKLGNLRSIISEILQYALNKLPSLGI